MAIQNTQSTVSNFHIRYSAFLGMLYVSTPDSEALIKEAKLLVGGETEVKKGFSGNKGNSASAKAIAFLREKGVTSVKLDGNLTSAKIVDLNIEGRESPYLKVSLRDEVGRYYLSIDLTQGAAQMLVRKLANAEIGVHTEINLFATYGQRQGAPRAYADHGASLKQAGIEIKSVNPADKLVPLIREKERKLEVAGITDRDTLAKSRARIEVDYHWDLMEVVTAKVDAFYAQTELPLDGYSKFDHDEPDDGFMHDDEVAA